MTAPSEIPKDLYDLIHNAFKARESLKRNPDIRFANPREVPEFDPLLYDTNMAKNYMMNNDQIRKTKQTTNVHCSR